jgi:hypothetical protein
MRALGNRRTGLRVATIIAMTLAIAGAVNWGLVGLFHFDCVKHVACGDGRVPETYTNSTSTMIYIVIAFAGLYCISRIAKASEI